MVVKVENNLEKSDEENEAKQLFELSLKVTSRKRKKQPKVLCLCVNLPEGATKETLESINTQSLPVSKLILVTELSSKQSLGYRISEVIDNALSKIDLTTYDYVLRVDSDNVLPPNFLEANLAVEPDIMGFGNPQIIKVKPFLEIMGSKLDYLQDDTYIRHKFAMHGLRTRAPVVTADLKQKTSAIHNLAEYKRRLELRGGVETWVTIEKQKTLGAIFRSKTSRLRSNLVFSTMRVLTPKLRDRVKDWLTYSGKTPLAPLLFILNNISGINPLSARKSDSDSALTPSAFLRN